MGKRHSAIRNKLIKRRNELLGVIEDREDQMTSNTADDEEDKLDERLEDEVLSALSANDQAELAKIDIALGKIADGSYGICENCGEDIAEDRLAVMPHAVLCINCAEAA